MRLSRFAIRIRPPLSEFSGSAPAGSWNGPTIRVFKWPLLLVLFVWFFVLVFNCNVNVQITPMKLQRSSLNMIMKSLADDWQISFPSTKCFQDRSSGKFGEAYLIWALFEDSFFGWNLSQHITCRLCINSRVMKVEIKLRLGESWIHLPRALLALYKPREHNMILDWTHSGHRGFE